MHVFQQKGSRDRVAVFGEWWSDARMLIEEAM
jgi:hypothetical protein